MPADPLVAEATRRSAVVWVDGRATWHVWHDDAMWLVTDGLEPPAPAAWSSPGATALVEVRSRARQGDLLVRWVAAVSFVAPGAPEWDAAVPLLHAARLNPPDGASQPERWARESRVWRLVPTGDCLPLPDDEVTAPTRPPGTR